MSEAQMLSGAGEINSMQQESRIYSSFLSQLLLKISAKVGHTALLTFGLAGQAHIPSV